MEIFNGAAGGRTFILRLDQGDYLLESIQQLIDKEQIGYGVVVSGIGTLDESVMHMVTTIGYPPVEYFDQKSQLPLELASIDGLIADGIPHLHMTISNQEQAFAGHLENGCRVLYLAEIVIQELQCEQIHRVRDQKNLLKLTKIE